MIVYSWIMMNYDDPAFFIKQIDYIKKHSKTFGSCPESPVGVLSTGVVLLGAVAETGDAAPSTTMGTSESNS